jgi:hypothetical protein
MSLLKIREVLGEVLFNLFVTNSSSLLNHQQLAASLMLASFFEQIFCMVNIDSKGLHFSVVSLYQALDR